MTAKEFARRLAPVLIVPLLVASLAACSESNSSSSDPSGEARAQALQAQAENEQQRQQAAVVTELLANFKEGAQPPEGWPANLVPVPAGTRPVASITRSKLPNGADTMSMFYSTSQAPGDVQSAFRSGLNDKDWKRVTAQEEGGGIYTITAEHPDGYNGMFLAGTLPSVPKLASGETINVLVILTTQTP